MRQLLNRLATACADACRLAGAAKAEAADAPVVQQEALQQRQPTAQPLRPAEPVSQPAVQGQPSSGQPAAKRQAQGARRLGRHSMADGPDPAAAASAAEPGRKPHRSASPERDAAVAEPAAAVKAEQSGASSVLAASKPEPAVLAAGPEPSGDARAPGARGSASKARAPPDAGRPSRPSKPEAQPAEQGAVRAKQRAPSVRGPKAEGAAAALVDYPSVSGSSGRSSGGNGSSSSSSSSSSGEESSRRHGSSAHSGSREEGEASPTSVELWERRGSHQQATSSQARAERTGRGHSGRRSRGLARDRADAAPARPRREPEQPPGSSRQASRHEAADREQRDFERRDRHRRHHSHREPASQKGGPYDDLYERPDDRHACQLQGTARSYAAVPLPLRS